MTAAIKKNVWLCGSLLLLAAVFAGSFYAVPWLLSLPLLLIGCLLLVQHPAALFYALLFFIPWSVEVNITNSLGTDLPDEPLMLLLSFAALALLLFRRGKSRLPLQFQPILLLLFAGFAWAGVTVLLSTHVVLSLKYFVAKSWYLLAFAVAPLVLVKDAEKLAKGSAAVLFGSMFLATCYAVAKHAAWGFTFASINNAVAPFFRNHVNYSALLVFMVPLQLAFLALTKSKAGRFFLLLSVLVVLVALAFSYARGAWLALAAGLAAYWLIKKGWLLKVFLLVVCIVLGLAFWLGDNDRYLQYAPQHDTTIFHQNFGEHLAATWKGKDVSTAERFYRWVAGVRMSSQHWLTGFGPTTFYQHYQSYAIPAFRTWVSDNREQSTVHNYFLLLLIEQGVPGLVLFLALLGALFWQAQTIYRRARSRFWQITVATVAAILWMQCTVNFLSDLIETDKAGSVFYLCVAFLLIADAKTKQTNDPEQHKPLPDH